MIITWKKFNFFFTYLHPLHISAWSKNAKKSIYLWVSKKIFINLTSFSNYHTIIRYICEKYTVYSNLYEYFSLITFNFYVFLYTLYVQHKTTTPCFFCLLLISNCESIVNVIYISTFFSFIYFLHSFLRICVSLTLLFDNMFLQTKNIIHFTDEYMRENWKKIFIILIYNGVCTFKNYTGSTNIVRFWSYFAQSGYNVWDIY